MSQICDAQIIKVNDLTHYKNKLKLSRTCSKLAPNLNSNKKLWLEGGGDNSLVIESEDTSSLMPKPTSRYDLEPLHYILHP
jgi:hypothetical protein